MITLLVVILVWGISGSWLNINLVRQHECLTGKRVGFCILMGFLWGPAIPLAILFDDAYWKRR